MVIITIPEKKNNIKIKYNILKKQTLHANFYNKKHVQKHFSFCNKYITLPV